MTPGEAEAVAQAVSGVRSYIRSRGTTPYGVRKFRKLVKDFYRDFGRDLPWRRTEDSYRILVSEVMLQQTQVTRVCEKFPEFIREFPDFSSLARASVKKLLAVWKGMGYNRRALALRNTALKVEKEYGGVLPDEEEKLVQLPGIGPATAADILAFAFSKPALVIETNIRAVYIHIFFSSGETVGDSRIRPLVLRTMDRKNPGDWYNGLMDLGAFIKKEYVNPASRSRHYTKQSPFEGSNRQMRSLILSFLMENGPDTADRISVKLEIPVEKTKKNLVQLEKEGFVRESGAEYSIEEV